jgi:hypothetical protein
MHDIAEFFEIPHGDAGWLDQACGLVRGLPATRFDKLEPAEQDRLEAAVAPAMALLDALPRKNQA